MPPENRCSEIEFGGYFRLCIILFQKSKLQYVTVKSLHFVFCAIIKRL